MKSQNKDVLKDNSAVHDTAVPVFSAEGNTIAQESDCAEESTRYREFSRKTGTRVSNVVNPTVKEERLLTLSEKM